MKLINEGKDRLSFLIESGMERASLVLAAQSITDSLQDMAEKLAKIEASDVMPMMDSMKENFGPEVAQRFEQTVSEKLRAMSEALRSARDEIGNEIIRMEASVNGQPVSDMQMDALNDETSDPEIGDMGADAADAPVAEPMDDAAGGDPVGGGEDSEQDFSSLFGDAPDAPLGRARKESVELTGVEQLKESSNPDQLIVARFRSELRECRETATAARNVAEYFEIDLDDVVDVILGSREA